MAEGERDWFDLRSSGRRNGDGRVNGHVVQLPPEIDSGEPGNRFSFVHPHEIELRPRAWLVPGLLPRRGFGVLFGPSGSGKSFWAANIGLSVALGHNLLGKEARRAGVIYVAAEDAEGVEYRTCAWLKQHGVKRDASAPLPFAIVPEAPDLWREDGDADALIAGINQEAAVLRAHGALPGLILVDTMRDAFPGMRENESHEMSTAVRVFRRIGEETGAFVLTVHHVPKGGDGEDPRGSTALIGAADVAFGVRVEESRPEERADQPNRVLWIRKQRNGPDARGDQSLRWAYELQRVELDVTGEDGNPETSCAVRVTGRPANTVPKIAKLSPGATIVEQAIVALQSDNMGTRPPDGIPCPPDRQAVRVEHVRERARRLGISDAACANPAEAVRKAVARGKQELITKRRIMEVDGWLWRITQ